VAVEVAGLPGVGPGEVEGGVVLKLWLGKGGGRLGAGLGVLDIILQNLLEGRRQFFELRCGPGFGVIEGFKLREGDEGLVQVLFLLLGGPEERMVGLLDGRSRCGCLGGLLGFWSLRKNISEKKMAVENAEN
jgi:hypothetical protein